jgi:hypothetical protein
MGEQTGDQPDVQSERLDTARTRVETDPDAPATPPKPHLTGRGLSPTEYCAQHGGHPHQADFSRGADGGDDSPAEAAGPGRPDRP